MSEPLAQLRVLVVDDNADFGESLALLLRLEGHDVRIASNGLHALGLADRFVPDAIILDVRLPCMDGYEVARRIRTKAWAKHSLIVALTGSACADGRAAAFEAGVNAYLGKPADPITVLRLVREGPLSCPTR
jgi:CheY-like chemotaxis protein